MEKKTQPILQNSITNPKHGAVWDCGSSLYDSFELKAFERQLDSAITSRTMSMPHLSDRRPHPPAGLSKKPASKISRSLQRLIRSVFGLKSNNTSKLGSGERFFVVYDKSAALSTIPEAPEFDGLSPEIRSLVRRTASDRFSATTAIGISCA
ncbi:uncharacterized protein LOC131024482 [Salvia miltiorrhiza]|uniref:uncharacterized protein LOC131024482 n=1 Tax=Salvia miltiorrhiza TaxID=226208 RepID=UPI0025ABCA3C|nr:uncharacterized protein LOC131024482 [Salvia miltiorrhiza]